MNNCTDIGARVQAIPRETIEPGKVHVRYVKGDVVLKYYIYVPGNINEHACQFVSVHGISRNAREHAKRFAGLAEEYGVILVAPYFSRHHFGDYQRLGREGAGHRADHAIRKITSEVEYLTGVGSRKVALFGFSGGGQFVHRYAMAYPEHVHKVVIGAAGWYTFPEVSREYPFGVAPAARLKGVDFNMDRFLRVPACVLVGQWDIQHDPVLNQSPRLQRQQGTTRLERGKRWIDAMNLAAKGCGKDTSYVFSVIPGINHDFTSAMKDGRMGQRVFSYLFGVAPSLPASSSQVHARLTGTTLFNMGRVV